MSITCLSLPPILTNGQQVTHRQHTRGRLETLDDRYFFQPDIKQVRFVNGFNEPFINRLRCRRWFARLMGIFA